MISRGTPRPLTTAQEGRQSKRQARLQRPTKGKRGEATKRNDRSLPPPAATRCYIHAHAKKKKKKKKKKNGTHRSGKRQEGALLDVRRQAAIGHVANRRITKHFKGNRAAVLGDAHAQHAATGQRPELRVNQRVLFWGVITGGESRGRV